MNSIVCELWVKQEFVRSRTNSSESSFGTCLFLILFNFIFFLNFILKINFKKNSVRCKIYSLSSTSLIFHNVGAIRTMQGQCPPNDPQILVIYYYVSTHTHTYYYEHKHMVYTCTFMCIHIYSVGKFWTTAHHILIKCRDVIMNMSSSRGKRDNESGN